MAKQINLFTCPRELSMTKTRVTRGVYIISVLHTLRTATSTLNK